MTQPKRAYFVLATIFLAIICSSYWAWGRPGLLWGFILSLAVHWLTFFYADQRLLGLFHAERLEGQDPWNILSRLKTLSQKARIPMPQVYMTYHETMNAYSVARNHKNSAIVLSRALTAHLSEDELTAVLAHEVARIKHLDTVNLSVTSALMSAILFFSFLLPQGKAENSKVLRALYAFFAHLTAPLALLVRRLTVSSRLYYAIDARAVELTQDSMAYAHMLWKLQSYASTKKVLIPPSTAHLFIVNPLTSRGWGRYFQAQPPLEQRVRRLIGYYPI